MLDKSPIKKFLPEIEIAVLFMAAVLIALFLIVVLLIWNGHANRKMQAAAHKVHLQYSILNDQFQRMQKEYVSVKFCIDNISEAVAEINLICKSGNPLSAENAAKLNVLKQKIQENKLNLGCDVELVKLNFGIVPSVAVQEYMDNLAKILAAPNTCTTEAQTISGWNAKAEALDNKLTSSMRQMADTLTQMLQKAKPGAK